MALVLLAVPQFQLIGVNIDLLITLNVSLLHSQPTINRGKSTLVNFVFHVQEL